MGSQLFREAAALERLLRAVQHKYGLARGVNLATEADEARAAVEQDTPTEPEPVVARTVFLDAFPTRTVATYGTEGDTPGDLLAFYAGG